MRYAAAEKLEIIRLVEQSSLSVRRFRIFCGCMTPNKAAEMWGFFAKVPGEGTGNYFS